VRCKVTIESDAGVIRRCRLVVSPGSDLCWRHGGGPSRYAVEKPQYAAAAREEPPTERPAPRAPRPRAADALASAAWRNPGQR